MMTADEQLHLKRVTQVLLTLTTAERDLLKIMLGTTAPASIAKIVSPITPEERAQAASGLDTLTSRERQVLKFMAEAKSTKVMAKALNIAPRTVEIYRGKVLSKMGVNDTVELCRLVSLL